MLGSVLSAMGRGIINLEVLRDNLECLRVEMDAKDQAREQALQISRAITRSSSIAIKHVHRGELDEAAALIEQTRGEVEKVRSATEHNVDLWHAGFVQDALKEFVEASLSYAFLCDGNQPTHQGLGVEAAPYLNGLAEAMGELRRSILDCIRHADVARAESLLEIMDEVYYLLLTFDYPEAMTLGLRRRVDQLRGILERTRGDVTLSLQSNRLAQALKSSEAGIDDGS